MEYIKFSFIQILTILKDLPQYKVLYAPLHVTLVTRRQVQLRHEQWIYFTMNVKQQRI